MIKKYSISQFLIFISVSLMCLKTRNQFYLSQDSGKIYKGRIMKEQEKGGNIIEIELIYQKQGIKIDLIQKAECLQI